MITVDLPTEHTHSISLQVHFIVEIDTLISGHFVTNKRFISVEVNSLFSQ